jgi:hypothetical protein
MMQQQLATSMGGGGNPMMGGAGGMNPQMMQQMMAMQQGMGQGESFTQLFYLRSRLLTSFPYRRHEPSHDATDATNAAADAAGWR